MSSPLDKWIIRISDKRFFHYVAEKVSKRLFCDIEDSYWGTQQFILFEDLRPHEFIKALIRNDKWKRINAKKTPPKKEVKIPHACVTLPKEFDNANRSATWHIAHWTMKISGFLDTKTYGISFDACGTIHWQYNLLIFSWIYSRAVERYGEDEVKVCLPILPLERPLLIKCPDGPFALIAPIAGGSFPDPTVVLGAEDLKI